LTFPGILVIFAPARLSYWHSFSSSFLLSTASPWKAAGPIRGSG